MGIPSVSLFRSSRSSGDREIKREIRENAILLRAKRALLFVHSILDIIKVESATSMLLLYNSQLSHWDGDHRALMNLKESMGHSHTSFPQLLGQQTLRCAVTKGLRLSTFAVSISMYGSLDLASRVRSQGTCALGQTFSSYAFSARTSHGLYTDLYKWDAIRTDGISLHGFLIKYLSSWHG